MPTEEEGCRQKKKAADRKESIETEEVFCLQKEKEEGSGQKKKASNIR